MFASSVVDVPFDPSQWKLDPAPLQVKKYRLDDESNVLPGKFIFEYDFVYDALPSKLGSLIEACLRGVRAAGAEVAWFGFEGSFDFGCLLASEIANQVYAIADSDGVALASDAMLVSMEWCDRVAQAGKRLTARTPTIGTPGTGNAAG
jgi:hypothetical protein